MDDGHRFARRITDPYIDQIFVLSNFSPFARFEFPMPL